MSDYEDALDLIDQAKTAGDLFDSLLGGEDDAAKEYRRLAKILHPDLHREDELRAQRAFARLSQLWGQYGKQPISDHFTISTKRHAYVVERAPTWEGDMSNLYRCEHYEDSDAIPGVMKIPRSPKNNDMMKSEAMSLKHISMTGDEKFKAYIPEHVESFRHRDTTDGRERLVNVLDLPTGLFSLQEVYDAYPNGIASRDVAWMWRRVLVALGYVHGAGRLHGAVTPEHILIHPEGHGVVLVDWCYSVEVGSPLKAIVPKRREMYPSFVFDKQDVDQNLDIRMATQCMMYVLRGRAPRQFKGFAKYSNDKSNIDAFRLKDEYDELLDEMFGQRRFISFEMPTTRS